MAVYRRWSAFRSPEQEARDPTWNLVQKLMFQEDASGRRRDPFTIAGMGSGLTAISGGIGRAMWVKMFSNILPAWAGVSSDFEREVGGVTLRQGPQQIRSVGDTLRFQSTYVSGGQTTNAAGAALQRTFETGRQIQEVAKAKTAEQPRVAEDVGVRHAAGIPLSGVSSAQAKAGWRYLIDVWDPMASYDEPAAQEARSMPHEVAALLLARRAEIAAHSQNPVPRAAGGSPIGEAAVRRGGIEAATGNAAARYLQGEEAPAVDPQIAVDKEAIDALRAEAGTQKGGRDQPEPVDEILARFSEYFDAYFARPMPAAQRVGTVLSISSEDWMTGGEVLQTLSPEGLANIAMEVGKQALVFSLLSALGPVGRVLAEGYRAYMQTQGVDEVAAIITLTAFFREASTVASFEQARGLGFMGKAVEGDLVELIEAVVGKALQTGISHLAEAPPRTAGDAAAYAADLAKTPEAKKAMVEALDAEIAHLAPDHPDRGGLLALRDGLTGQKTPDADPSRALPDTKDSASVKEFQEFAPRTKAEIAALQAEIPADLKGAVPVVEAVLPPGVTARVVYDTSKVVIEVSRFAEPADVRQHVSTARHLARFTGVIGAVRRVIDRIQKFVTGNPAIYGTAGFEAELEIRKLRDIESEVNAELDRIHRTGGDPSELEGKLSDLHGQIAEYEAAIHSAETGRGWVAAGQGKGNQEARAKGLVAPEGHYFRLTKAGKLTLVKFDQAASRYEMRTVRMDGNSVDWPVDQATGRRYMEEMFEAVGERTAWATIQHRMADVQAGVAQQATPKQQKAGAAAEASLRFQTQEAKTTMAQPAPEVTDTTRILDTQMIRQIKDARDKMAAGKPLSAQEQRALAFDTAQGATPDYRVTNMVGSELDPNRGFGPLPSTPTDVGRNDPAYRATLTDLETKNVGEGSGTNAAADRSVIADVLHAQMAVGQAGPATLVTSDFHFAISMWKGYTGNAEHQFVQAAKPLVFSINVGGRTARIEYHGK